MIARNRDFIIVAFPFAGVAELADARDSKSRSVMSVGSIPTAGIFFDHTQNCFAIAVCNKDGMEFSSYRTSRLESECASFFIRNIRHYLRLEILLGSLATGF